MASKKTKQVVRWFTPKQLSQVLGISEEMLQLMRNSRRGPRYKKLGPTQQSTVVYAEPDVAAWQSRQLTIETE
jgi:predicted DNA-binding transcriptional regulator AlpA